MFEIKCSICYNLFMKTFGVKKDIKTIRQLFKLTQTQFAKEIGLSRSNIARYESEEIFPHNTALEKIYSFPYKHDFHLNKAKEMLFLDNAKDNILLFHGAKYEIKGGIDYQHLNGKKDLGAGFYLGESFDSSASWICEYQTGSIYSFYFKNVNSLNCMTFKVDRTWMYAILYFRGMFEEYVPNKEVLDIIEQINKADYIVAPIADNQMYDTLTAFSLKEITDEQCLHALSANNLGKQIVIKTQKAVDNLILIERMYLCEKEKEYYRNNKSVVSNEGRSKASLSIEQYRRKGKFIDEIFKKR